MASLLSQITLANRAYTQAQDTFINDGVRIILDFLNENNINEIDFTEINGTHYKELYETTKIPYWEDGQLEVATILKLITNKTGLRVVTDKGEWYYTDKTSYCDPDEIQYADANTISSLLDLVEFLSVYYIIEHKAVFIAK